MAQDTSALEALGIAFVDESEVPEPPTKRESHADVWAALAAVLPQAPGQWARALTYGYATGAGAMAGKINNGKEQKFPSDKFEARYEVTRKSVEADEENGVEADRGESVLYVRYIG